MFGATSFPTTTTPFTSGSSALAPASAPVVIGATSRMTPFDSMFEVLTEVRNSVDNLGRIFAERISGLNSHLAFRLGGVYDILDLINTNIIAMGKNQETIAGIEDKKFQEFKENEQEDERRDSLGKGKDDSTPGVGIVQSLKDAFESFKGFFGKLMPDSDLGKLGLFGAIATLITMNLDKIIEPLSKAFKFLDEKVFPNVKKGFNIIKEDFGGEDGVLDKLFGSREDSVVSSLMRGFGSIIDGFKEDDPEKKLKGAKIIFTEAVPQFVKAIALGVGSLIDSVFALFGVDSDIVGKGSKLFSDLGEAVKSFGRKTKSFFVDGFNDLTSSIKNIFVDIEVADGPAGAMRTQRSMIGKIKDDMIENFKQNVQGIKDFFFDEEGNLFGINFSAMADMMPTLQEIVDTIISALPQWMRPDTIQEKLAEQEALIEEELARIARSEAGENEYKFTSEKQGIKGSQTRIEKAQKKIEELKIELEEKFPGSTTTNITEIQKGNNNIMKEKTNELKEVVNEKSSVTGTVNFVDTSVKKGGDNISYSTHTSYPIRILHDESSAKALSETS